jgi:hypothetical protein
MDFDRPDPIPSVGARRAARRPRRRCDGNHAIV